VRIVLQNNLVYKNDLKEVQIACEEAGVITHHDSLRKCGKYLNRDVAAVYRCLDGEWNLCNGHKLYYINT